MAADSHRFAADILTASATKQCIGFMIGAGLFALGSAPGFAAWAGASVSNVAYFIGAWFFTGAALIQLVRSGPVTTSVPYGTGVMLRAEWLAGATQFFGTLLFNVSTTSALEAKTIHDQQQLVWNPDAGGSVAFLISGVLVLVAFTRANGRVWAPRSTDWWSGVINMVGCIAFGVSAVGSFVSRSGNTVDAVLANVGTFIGALCFFVASFIVLVAMRRRDREVAA